MSLSSFAVSVLAAAGEEHHSPYEPYDIGMNPFAYGGIALAVLLLLAAVTWSYRNVANRHSEKFGRGPGDHGGHGAGARGAGH